MANGGNGNWFLSTTVNLTKRQDNGRINSSPISALSPIVRHQQGCSKTITIPAEDSDGDKVRCRWSTGSRRECGSVCQRFQSGNLDEVSLADLLRTLRQILPDFCLLEFSTFSIVIRVYHCLVYLTNTENYNALLYSPSFEEVLRDAKLDASLN